MYTEVTVNHLHASIEGEDEDQYILIVLDKGVDTNDYIMMQKALNYTEDDIELGMNKVYIECKSQRFSTYGGIKKINLKDGLIEIFVDKETATKLNMEEHILVMFPQNHINYPDIKKYLKLMVESETNIELNIV